MGNMIELTHDGKNFPAYIAESIGKTKGGLILIHEVWGLPDHIKHIADRYAEQGYTVIAPDLLSETGMTEQFTDDLQEQLFDPKHRNEVQPRMREYMSPLNAPDFAEITIKKLKECFKYLEDNLDESLSIGITGFCFGGSYSYSFAVVEPKIKVAIPFYGHCNYSVDELSSIKCPILAFYGENDQGLISGLDELKANMKAAGVDYTAQVYPNCGHAFFNDTNKFAYNEVAAKDAWDKALNFLDANI